MLIGLDACGSFAAIATDGFESSAIAAAVVPATATAEISAWTQTALGEWNREELGELHAAELNWTQRREVCEMLGARGDVHVAVVVTSSILLRSAEAVSAHRARQLRLAEVSLERARTSDGRERGVRACRLLAGRRVGRSRLNDREYVLAAMVPIAVVGAAQRTFCFYAADHWRSEMTELELVMDEETPATARYVAGSLLPVIGGDDRFRLVLPDHWREAPEHPLLTQARHPDGEGLWPQRILGEQIDWASSHDEPAIQVADVAAWVVCRTISRPEEQIARECFELLRPVIVGERGRCFDLFSIGAVRVEDDAVYAHLHSKDAPEQWLTALASG